MAKQQALNQAYLTASATKIMDAFVGDKLTHASIITNRGSGTLYSWATNGSGIQQGAKVAIPPNSAQSVLMSPVSSNQYQIWVQGESADGVCDVSPINQIIS